MKGDSLINGKKSDTIFIDIYEIVNDELYLMGNTFKKDSDSVGIYFNDELIQLNELNFPQRKEYSNYSFEASIPLSNKESILEFRNEYGAKYKIDFSRPCNFSKAVGYAKSKHHLSVLNKNKIIIKPKTTISWIKKELKSQFNMLKEGSHGAKVGVPFRIAYMLGYPFLRNKHIWFFMDLPTIADDNGKHLFKYYMENNLRKDVDKYFILSSDSENFEEMKKIGKVIPYKSLKHRYLGLFAENIITSHPDNEIIYPFWGTFPHLAAGLLKSSTTFLQHGVTKDNVSTWLNKFDMNLSLFVTSSHKEYESIFQYPYNYKKDVVKLTGMPRFDNLKNEENKKQILIMPSWRKYLRFETSETIAESEFFKRFNSLINNPKLIEYAKDNGYEIIFRPHPNVYKFIDLFDENEFVKIDYEKGNYQELFNKGSLLITDYSSVAFDFAYIKKPVLYYHYSNDYHFDLENMYYDYETMGFGEICSDEESLTDLIIEYIENECKIKEKYSQRVDEFYAYTDRNNCKRVSEAIDNIPLKN